MRTARGLDADGLWEFAVKALAGRAHSAGQIREKLRRRAARQEDVDATLARLKDLGYLNDRAFAESFAAARLQNQRLGSQRVLRDLRERRVAPTLAERTVRQVYQEVDEDRLIEDYLRRKHHVTIQGEKELAAAYRRLRHAGFSSGAIVRVLKRLAKDPDLLDNFEPPEEPMEENP